MENYRKNMLDKNISICVSYFFMPRVHMIPRELIRGLAVVIFIITIDIIVVQGQ